VLIGVGPDADRHAKLLINLAVRRVGKAAGRERVRRRAHRSP
jgi:hypothetical protein